jgi:hypothetical protein
LRSPPCPTENAGAESFHYRHPAFLLTTMLESSTRQLLQMYFDGWQIEVNHRDELKECDAFRLS